MNFPEHWDVGEKLELLIVFAVFYKAGCQLCTSKSQMKPECAVSLLKPVNGNVLPRVFFVLFVYFFTHHVVHERNTITGS